MPAFAGMTSSVGFGGIPFLFSGKEVRFVVPANFRSAPGGAAVKDRR